MIKELVDLMKNLLNKINIVEYRMKLITNIRNHNKSKIQITSMYLVNNKHLDTDYLKHLLDVQKLIYLNYSKVKTNKMCIHQSILILIIHQL
jgi:hypothetical protein